MPFNKVIPDEYNGEFFTLEEWSGMVSYGAVTPDDGSAYQATAEGYDPNLDGFDFKVNSCTHVVWFNK